MKEVMFESTIGLSESTSFLAQVLPSISHRKKPNLPDYLSPCIVTGNSSRHDILLAVFIFANTNKGKYVKIRGSIMNYEHMMLYDITDRSIMIRRKVTVNTNTDLCCAYDFFDIFPV